MFIIVCDFLIDEKTCMPQKNNKSNKSQSLNLQLVILRNEVNNFLTLS